MSRLAVAATLINGRRGQKQPGGTRKQVRQLKAQHHVIKKKNRQGVKSRNGLR